MRVVSFSSSQLQIIAVTVIIVGLLVQYCFGSSLQNLNSDQKQKYWKHIKSKCQPLLLEKKHEEYRLCVLDALAKAGQPQSPQPWCTDSDGIDFMIKGMVKTDTFPDGVVDSTFTAPSGIKYVLEGTCSAKMQLEYIQKNCEELGSNFLTGDGVCVLKNNPPVINPIGDKEIKIGEELKFTVSGSDPDDNPIQISTSGIPDGAVFEDSIFTWKPTSNQSGTHSVVFSITDGTDTTSEEVKLLVIGTITELCGQISKDTVLTKDKSPYVIKCHLLVEKTAKLTVMPGVTLKFDGPYYVKVEGTLVADGTQAEMIVFTSNKQEPKPGDWDKIRFEDSSVDWDGNTGSVIRYATIEYSGAAGQPAWAAITAHSASPLIEYNEIFNFSQGFIFTYGLSGVTIKNNLIHSGTMPEAGKTGYLIAVDGNTIVQSNAVINNKAGAGLLTAIACSDGSKLIENNIVTNNSGDGIQCGGDGASIIKGNTVSDNGSIGIAAYGAASLIKNKISNHKGKGIEISGIANGIVLEENFITGSPIGLHISKNSNSNGISPVAKCVKNTITGNGTGIFVLMNAALDFSQNNIYNNSEYALFIKKPNSELSTDINAPNNYWGTTDENAINKLIYDFHDDFDLPKVKYAPIVGEMLIW